MAVTINLKPKVDLPVWEWCRPLPVATSSISCTCHSADNRYIYYIATAALYRYDTFTDSWQQLASPITTPTNLIQIKYSTAHGHYGRIISNGGGANTVELAALQGDAFVGKKIKILSGKGVGQERTITAVSDPIIQDRGVTTSASTTQIVDASSGAMIKFWRLNQWRDYQVRLVYGQLANLGVRPVLYNTDKSLTISDPSIASITPWWGPTLAGATSSTAGSQTMYQIESNIVTVDSNWAIQPDSTSNFVIMSDGIWMITSNASAPFYSFQYYDVGADIWYLKTNSGGIFSAALGTDVAMEIIPESSSPLLTGSVFSANSGILTDSSLNLTPTTYANYELRIISGSGIGQTRTILSNNSGSFFPVRNFDTIPASGDTYGVYKDVNKIFLVGNNASAIAQYEVESDFTFCGKRFDWGVARTATVTASGQDMVPIAINSATYTTNGIISLDPVPTAPGSGYLSGQLLSITEGSSSAAAKIIGVNISGGVTQVALDYNGSSYTTGPGKATTVSPLGGAGCTLNILSVGPAGLIITSTPHYFKIGDSVTITGFNQSEYNGTKTIIGNDVVVSSNASRLVVSLSNGLSPTITNTQSATSIFDLSKNWITNEHIGKLVIITTAFSPNTTTVIRRITGNTSNSLSFATITTAATNGTHRYAIISDKAFGTDESIGSVLAAPAYSGRGRGGVATGGTTTSLIDSSKNWPSNYWANTNPTGAGNTGRKVRIIKGTGAGNEMIITSNSATTLTFAAQSFTPDSTSVYIILDNFGIVTTGGTTTLTDSTQNWGTNIWSGKRVRITGGTGAGTESVINSNTQTTLTLASTLNADTTSTYAILAPNNRSTGIAMFNIKNSSNSNFNKYIYIFRGGGTNEIIRYNIVTEEIDNITYFPLTETYTTGSMYAYDGVDRIYIQKDATGRVMYYDIVKNIVVNSSTIPHLMGSATIGNRMEISQSTDGLKYLYMARHTAQEFWRTLLFW
jgi:hypothetical protein